MTGPSRNGRRDDGFRARHHPHPVRSVPADPAAPDRLGLAFSIALSVLILMVALWIQRPLDFSAFPTVLLIATLLRLSLNIATTRLILSHGSEGATAAGYVIAGFAQLRDGRRFRHRPRSSS